MFNGPKLRKTPAKNMKTKLPTIQANAKSLGRNSNLQDIWRLEFDNAMITQIVVRTYQKLETMRNKL